MAEANPKVMEMVEAELKQNPDISNRELLDKAKSLDKGVAKLTPRQFNATYPLQVKRALNPPKKRGRRAAKKAGKGDRPSATRARASAAPSKGRDRVRTVLLELARDVANAQGKGDVVDVIIGIDRYVDRVVKAAG